MQRAKRVRRRDDRASGGNCALRRGVQFHRLGQGRGCPAGSHSHREYASRISAILPHSMNARRNGPILANNSSKQNKRKTFLRDRGLPDLQGEISARYAMRRDLSLQARSLLLSLRLRGDSMNLHDWQKRPNNRRCAHARVVLRRF